MTDDTDDKVITRIGKFGGTDEAVTMLRQMADELERGEVKHVREVGGIAIVLGYSCVNTSCHREHVVCASSANGRLQVVGMLEEAKLYILDGD